MSNSNKAAKQNPKAPSPTSNLRSLETRDFKHNFFNDPLVYSPDIWDELRIFLSVAKNRSFNAAAAKLGVSQPTVSRAVKQLEATLRQTLTVSDQRGIRLTQKGEEIALLASQLDQSLADMTLKMRKAESDVSGLVSLAMTEGLAGYWVAPQIAALCTEYPDVSVNIKQLVDVTDLAQNASDLMVVFAKDTRSDVFCDYLGKLHFTTFCSHAYVDRHGMPNKDNLKDHYFIQSDLNSRSSGPWHLWNDLIEQGTVSHSSNMSVSYAHLCRYGAGIAYLGNYITEESNAVPLDLGVEQSVPLYLVGRKAQENDPVVALVRETIVSTFRDNHWFGDEFTLRDAGSRKDIPLKDLFSIMPKVKK